MEKPKDYDNTQIIGDYETLEAGAYKCKILKVEELKASNDKDYLKISFDIAEGDKKDFYKKRYQNDTRENKKWGGVLVIFVKDFENNTNRYFKTLITSVEASNNKFVFDWEKPDCMTNKKVGIVFREEEYEDEEGLVRIAVKPFRACVYDKTEETKIPKKKELPPKNHDSIDDFIANDNGDDLPF